MTPSSRRARRGLLAALVGTLGAAIGVVPTASPAAAATTTVTPSVVTLPMVDGRDVVVEPTTGRVFVSGDAMVAVRAADGSAVGSVTGLGGAADLVVDASAVYVLRPGAAVVTRIDPRTLQVTGSWSLAPRTGPIGLAVASGRLWTTARTPALEDVLVSVDPASGVVATASSDQPVVRQLLRGVPGSPGLLVGGRSTGAEGGLRTIDVSVAPVVVGPEQAVDGAVRDLAVSSDGAGVVVAAGEGSVEERSLPTLEPTGARYPVAWHETAVASAAVGAPGAIVAAADLGLGGGQPDLWVSPEGAASWRRRASIATPVRELATGALAFGVGGARLYAVRRDLGDSPALPAELLVADLGPTITGVAPRVVGTRGGGRVTILGSGLGDATLRVGGKPTTGGSGPAAARSVTVASLPSGFATVEASNDLGVTALSSVPVVARDLGPFADSRGFVDRQVRDVVGRAATSGEVLLADAGLASGGSLGALPVSLVRTAPTSTSRAPIIRLYQAIFLRPPDTAGLEYWAGELRRGRTLTQIATSMAAAPEFRTRYGLLGDAAFVDRIYLNVLGRTADADGRAYWVGVLRRGQPRGKVVLGFAQSPEYVTRMAPQVDITNLHVAMLGRTPTKTQLSSALALAAASSVEAVAAAIVTSAEYERRVG